MLRQQKHMGVLLALLVLPALVPAMSADDDGAQEPVPSVGGIWKVVDERGRVTFTDRPPQSGGQAEAVAPRTPNVYDSPQADREIPQAEASSTGAAERAAVEYQVTLLAPQSEKVFVNPQEPIPLEATVHPALRPGHRLVLLDNGEALPAPELRDPVRGAHQLQVQVVDARGRVLAASEPVTVYVQRPMVRRKPAG